MRINYKHLFWLVALVILSNVAHGQDREVKYFAKFLGIISPFLGYEGRGELTESKAQEMNHYRFIYEDEKLAEIKYFNRSLPGENSYFGTHHVQYRYSKNKLVKSYFNAEGEKASLWRHYYGEGEIHQEQFETNGDVTTLSFFDKKGERINVGGCYKYQCKQLGDNKFFQQQFNASGEPEVLTNYFPLESTIITKDANGHLHKIINVDAETMEVQNHPKVGYSEVIFNFNDYGSELSWEFRNVDGDLVDRIKEEIDPGYSKWVNEFAWYDESLGHFSLMKKKLYSSDNQLVADEKGVYVLEYTFDEAGDFVGQRFLDHNGRLMMHPDNEIARFEIVRDDSGRKLEERMYDETGELRKEGVAIRKFQYNDKSKLIEVIQYNHQLMPIDES